MSGEIICYKVARATAIQITILQKYFEIIMIDQQQSRTTIFTVLAAPDFAVPLKHSIGNA